jgi:hypothetical protein
MKHSPLIHAVVFSLVAFVGAQSLLAQAGRPQQGQGAQQTPPKPAYLTSKGTLGEVRKKGRTAVLVIVPEVGEPIEVILTSKIHFEIEAKGDEGFLREKQIVSGTGTLTNKMLFVKNWKVHVGLSARKIKTGVVKAGKKIGQSVNAFHLTAMITKRQQDKDYPEYETLTLNLRELRGQPVYIDKNPTVTVSTTDTSMAKVGSPVEYYQVPAPGNRFKVIGVKIMLEDALKSEEYFAKTDKKKKKR